MRSTSLLPLAILAALVTIASCGGNGSPANPNPVITPTPTPEPTPTPTPTQPPPCQLTAPKVNCATRPVKRQELAEFLQPAVNFAVSSPGVMYADGSGRIYDLDLFRSKVVERLTAKDVCGAWDYGNVTGDEIYTRSSDGCVVEQYDLITGEGGVRSANSRSNVWSSGWGEPVPKVRPAYAKQGDLTCELPGDRSTFCFSIKGSHGEFGPRIYALLEEVLAENPTLIDKGDFLPGQGQSVPEALRPGAWRILNTTGYVSQLEAKIRANGFCGWVDRGDILKVKSLEKGNLFHEEFDVIQNPATGGNYTAFIVKDRCHNAGF